MKFLEILPFLVFGLLQTAVNAKEAQVRNETQPPAAVHYMSIETSCTSDSILVMASLEEPFYGVIYAKGYASIADCSIDGAGSRILRMALNVSECGVRYIESEEGKRQLDVSLYVQYDRLVQQAVDEQIIARCTVPIQDRTEEISSQEVIEKAVMKSSRRSDVPEPNKILQTNRPFATSNPKISSNSLYSVLKKFNNSRTAIKPTSNIIKSSTVSISQQQDTVSCWMDILAGTDPMNKPVQSFLRVGQEATLVVKVKQAAGLDTRLTNCVAHDGSHEIQQDLLDANGCSVDPAILPNVQERNNVNTGIRLLYATFQAFKFPERNHLHIKCSVIVCKGRCPNNACRLIRRRGRNLGSGKAQVSVVPASNPGKILTGKPGVVRPLSLKELAEMGDVRPATRLRTNDRLLSESQTSNSTNRPSVPVSNDQSASSIPVGTIIDKVDVFNSVEVRAADQEVSRSPKGVTSNSVGDEGSSEEAIFCLTPSKLFLSFGVLLAILLAAMLFAICVCIKAKSKSRKYAKQSNFLAPSFNGNQHPPLNSNYMAPTPVQLQQQTLHRQQFQRHNSSSTYVRVFK